jgi:hypothetical protein
VRRSSITFCYGNLRNEFSIDKEFGLGIDSKAMLRVVKKIQKLVEQQMLNRKFLHQKLNRILFWKKKQQKRREEII